MVIVDNANEVELLVKLREVGLADIEKGTTLTETVALGERPPPTPVTVIE
jgi:hypothetical protein